jgi:hypothetical protein
MTEPLITELDRCERKGVQSGKNLMGHISSKDCASTDFMHPATSKIQPLGVDPKLSAGTAISSV